MLTNEEMLRSILKTAQLGQVGIRSVMDSSMNPALRRTLLGQLLELDAIESEAHAIASQRGWELPELSLRARFLTDFSARRKLNSEGSDSGIADMIIRGNTGGMIRSLKDLHRFPSQDGAIRGIGQKLLDCQQAAISGMQGYL